MIVSHHRLSLHPRISIFKSPDSSLEDVLLSMRFGLTRPHLPLKRSFAYYSTITSGSGSTMAAKSETPVEISREETDKGEDKKEKEVSSSLPPPPEKPEAGDCCGSGCVRCVWDVYYDELEEYNNKTAKLLSTSISGETKSN